MAIPVLLFVVALAARVLGGLLFLEPAYPDAYYYVNLARALAGGEGFQVDYIWNFVEVGGVLPEEGRLPIPSNGHWMPLAALVQVPFIWLLGPTPLASAVPFWVASAAVAPVTYAIGRSAGLTPIVSAMAGVLAALPAGVTPYLGQPDNLALFMLLGALALWACGRGLAGDGRAFAAGGVAVGLAFLSRNDGILLGVPFVLAFVLARRGRPTRPAIGWWPALLCVAGLALVASPWLLRQLDVFGSISPSAASGRILWITDYRELYSVSSPATPAAFLAQGATDIISGRIRGLAFAVLLFTGMPFLFVLVPLLAVGAWVRRRDPLFIPWLAYGAALFAFSTLVSAVHVPYGTFLHSLVALLPHAYVLVFIGLGVIVRRVAARRPGWEEAGATRGIGLILAGVVVVAAGVATIRTVSAWTEERDSRLGLLAALDRTASPRDRVMSPDAGAYRYHGGWTGIVTPDDPLPVVREALERYGVRWLALEQAHLVPSLEPVLEARERPTWLSAPIVEVPSDEAGDEGPRAALYEVCLGRTEPGSACGS